MGRRRKVQRAGADGTGAVLDVSATSSEESQSPLLKLSEDFVTMLAIVKENGSKLDSIDGRMRSLEQRVISVEKAQLEFHASVTEVQARVVSVESETDSIKNQISVITSEAMALRKNNIDLASRLMMCEYQVSDSNIIVWNLPCDSKEDASEAFKQVCLSGLEVSEVPKFTVLQNMKDQKFFKVNVFSREKKIDLLKVSKNLKGKSVRNLKEIYISDDAPLSVREARKSLFEKKAKLKDIGISAWVSKTVPPFLYFDRPNGSRAKFCPSDIIPELNSPRSDSNAHQRSQVRGRGLRGGKGREGV